MLLEIINNNDFPQVSGMINRLIDLQFPKNKAALPNEWLFFTFYFGTNLKSMNDLIFLDTLFEANL